MKIIITWLNNNQGFALSLLTLAYVICTAVIVRKMASANSLTQQSLRQGVELERQRSRPYVMFDVESRPNQLVYAVVKNTGLTAAYHVKVHCDSPLSNEFRHAPSTLVSNEIEFLAPQRTLEDIIANVGHFPSEASRTTESTCEVIKGHVAYEDAQGNKYREVFSVDLAQNKKRVIFQPDRIARDLGVLTSTVNAIARKIGAKN